MKNEYILSVVLVALIAVVALQTVQLVGLKNNISGNTIALSGGTSGASSLLPGETVDQMNQRMHGTSASGTAAPAAASSSAPRQVGGC